MNLFTFETTMDGSPTLRIETQGSSQTLSEAMHSLKGAFSETLYIYGTAIERTLEKKLAPRILSMGLGLGYVEMLAAGLLLKHGYATRRNDVAIESFESLPELRAWLTDWLRETGECPSDFTKAYDDILERTAKEVGIDQVALKSFLVSLSDGDQWHIREALEADTQFETRFGCICFDAFSSKSTPEVWGEEFLKSFLEKSADTQCVLSTYACTGNLKRALREAGFEVQIRQGFSSKRDSTFAERYLA